jgi:undecaprenyl-diphosphatase
MELVQAIVLGILQGVFEWLPVSSQGQVMVAAITMFGIAPEQALVVSIFLHLGTVVAAATYFRKELIEALKFKDAELMRFIVVALLSSAITGVPLYILLKKGVTALATAPVFIMLLVGVMLFISGLMQRRMLKGKPKSVADMQDGVLTGLAQGIAIIPGISRSGITTAALLMRKFDAEKAFKLSFILSVPSIAIGELLLMTVGELTFEPTYLIAAATAGIVGFASIGVLIRIARMGGFYRVCLLWGMLYVGFAAAELMLQT